MTPEPAPRAYRDLVRDARFGPFLVASLITNVGNWFHVVAAVIVVYELTGSAFMVGLISFANFAGFLFLSPWAGRTTDRFRRRDVLLAAHGASFLAATALALAFVAGRGSAGVVLVASGVLGVGAAFSIPATLSIVPELVAPEDLPAGIALNAMAINIARVVGPVAGAAMLEVVGAGAAFTVNAGSFLVFLVVAARLAADRLEARPATDDGRYRGALVLIWRTPRLRTLFFGIAIVGVMLEPNTTLTAPVAALLDGGSSLVGWLVGAFGLGALAGAWPARRSTSERVNTAQLGFLLGAAGMGAATVATVAWPALAGFAALGGGYLAAITWLTTEIQRSVPSSTRGRVMAVYSQTLLGVRPISSLALGGTADLLTVRASLALVAGLALVGALLLHRTAPPPSAGTA